MKLNDIKTPVSSVTGVGPQLLKSLAKLNIFTVSDLLQFFPRDYEDRTKKVYLKDFAVSKRVHTVAKVLAHSWFGFGNMKTLKILITDGTANAELICFHRPFLEKTLPPGAIISVTGQFYVKYNSIQSSNFEASRYNLKLAKADVGMENEISREQLLELMPVDSVVFPIYRLCEGITQKQISKIMKNAITQYGRGIENEIPDDLMKKYKLINKQSAISMVHIPETLEEALSARRTLAYEELFKFQYSILSRAYKRRGSLPENVIESKKEEKNISIGEFKNALSPLQLKLLEKIPFDLTQDQMRVIIQMNEEIDRGYMERNKVDVEGGDSDIKNVSSSLQSNSGGDSSSSLQSNRGVAPISSVHTMNRLLQGDVGAGKTLVALFVCLRAINWKGQCAFMAPTEILARQHADKIAKMLDCIGIRTAFLTGNIKASGRNQLLKALKDGEIDIVIGTHALFSAQVVYNDLQLAVIDEQHRFGVAQRQAILAKGRTSQNGVVFEPHLLMMSATPIPQSLALTMFSDLDISVIKTLPDGRKPIQTYLVKEGNETNAYEAVRKELQKGHQAYFVYPAIEADNDFFEESGEADYSDEENTNNSNGALASGTKLKSAQKNFENLSKNVFKEFKCALVHGKMDEEEQVKTLEDFHDGKIQVLAATTVIEVGVDVSNATCMVIEQADRFGMAQLHQLRGRVGRGAEQSYCFLIYSKNISQSGIERMKTLRQSTDGFYIAEQDLKTRGPGEMNGTLQAGALEFNIADISRDKNIMDAARQDAIIMIKENRKIF